MSIHFGEALRELRKSRGITQQRLAEVIDVKKNTISNYENDVSMPNFKKMQLIAKYLDVSMDSLLNYDKESFASFIPYSMREEGDASYKTMVGIPVLSDKNREYEMQYAEDNIYMPESVIDRGEYLALKVKDDSMDKAKLVPGSIVLVRKQDQVKHGELALILVRGQDATIREVHLNSSCERIITLIPQSNNPEYVPCEVDMRKQDVRILGKAEKAIIEL